MDRNWRFVFQFTQILVGTVLRYFFTTIWDQTNNTQCFFSPTKKKKTKKQKNKKNNNDLRTQLFQLKEIHTHLDESRAQKLKNIKMADMTSSYAFVSSFY